MRYGQRRLLPTQLLKYVKGTRKGITCDRNKPFTPLDVPLIQSYPTSQQVPGVLGVLGDLGVTGEEGVQGFWEL